MKKFIAEKTNTSENDWDLIKESISKTYKQFRNKNDGSTFIVNSDIENPYEYENEYIPDSFLVVLPADLSKNQVDTSKVYINSDPMGFEGEPDGIEIVFCNTKSDIAMDQHVGHFVEDFIGIPNFLKDFDEVCENSHMLVSNMTLDQVIQLFTDHGLKFLGYEEYSEYH